MPRARQSACPIPAEIIPAWSTLLDRIEAFQVLAPWGWINGTSLLGVRDAGSGEVDWCSIMGQGGQTFGVVIYSGEAGLASYQRTVEDGPDVFDAVIQQRALVLTFNDRHMVTKEMVNILKACGRRYRGSKAWPELVEHAPGYYPIPPQGLDRLRRVTTTLECLMAMCADAFKCPGLDRHDEQNRPWVANPGADGKTMVVRESLPRIQAPPLPVLLVDEAAVARARRCCAGSDLLLDWFVGSAVINGPDAAGRPYYVTNAMAFDPRTGMIFGMEIGRLETVWQDMAKLLFKMCDMVGVPKQVMLRRAEAMHILGPTATALGIKLVHRPDTADAISLFRDRVQAFYR